MRSRKWLATLLATLLIFSTVASDIMVVCAEEAVEDAYGGLEYGEFGRWS